jgi:hypothetical protein
VIRDVELNRPGICSQTLRSQFAMTEIARAHEHGEALGCEIFRNLKTDSLVGSGHEGDGSIQHGNLQVTM